MIHFVNVVFAILLTFFLLWMLISPWAITAVTIVMFGWVSTQIVLSGIDSAEELLKKYKLLIAAAI